MATAKLPAKRDLAPLILAVLAMGVYANALGGGFITDDKLQLLQNPLIRDLSNIPTLFGSGVWDAMGFRSNYYRPAQFLAYMAVYAAAGFSAFAFHLLQAALHVGNTLLAYFTGRRLLPRYGAAMAAALFAAHPIHTEAVDWIAALPDLMVTAAALAAFLLFLRQGGSPRGLQIAGHCGLYLAALFSKEPGAMLLPIYVGYEWLYLGRRVRDLWKNAALYGSMLGAFGIYAALRMAALGGLAPSQGSFHRLSAMEFVPSAVATAGRYLAALLFPANLNFFHVFEPTPWLSAGFAISLAALAGLGALTRRGRLASFAIFFTAVTLAPALNLNGVGQNVFSERYLYLPSLGFCWILGAAWGHWAGRAPRAAWAAAIAILTLYSARTALRNADWRDNYTLLTATLRQSPTAGVMHNELASVYVDRNDLAAALEQQRLAARFEPENALIRRNLGYLLLKADPAAAVREFEAVVRLQPSLADGYYGLGLAWRAARDDGKAAAAFQKQLAVNPADEHSLMALSEVYRDAGRAADAVAMCRRAAAAQPSDPEPYIKLAVLYEDANQYQDAIRAAQEAIRLAPAGDRAFVAHYALGLAYGRLNSLEAAAAEFANALQLRPDFEQAKAAYVATLSRLRGKR